MLERYPATQIMFLDIETTSKTDKFSELNERDQNNFLKKFKRKGTQEILDEVGPDGKKHTKAQLTKLKEKRWSELAPLSSLFGRILCISVGFLVKDQENGGFTMRRKSYYNEDEKILLQEFVNGPLKPHLDNPMGKDSYALSAFNGKVFDFPFISTRLIVNRIPLPSAFDYVEKKPWEIPYFIDLKVLTSFNVFDGANSMDSWAAVMEIPSSKDQMDGSEVKDAFWKDKDLAGIVRYCEKDVVVLSELHLAVTGVEGEVRLPDGR